jgi:hypothetical protein
LFNRHNTIQKVFFINDSVCLTIQFKIKKTPKIIKKITLLLPISFAKSNVGWWFCFFVLLFCNWMVIQTQQHKFLTTIFTKTFWSKILGKCFVSELQNPQLKFWIHKYKGNDFCEAISFWAWLAVPNSCIRKCVLPDNSIYNKQNNWNNHRKLLLIAVIVLLHKKTWDIILFSFFLL